MAVELASAYVSIVPSAQGMAKNLTRELGGPLDLAAGSAGKRAGGIFSGALGGVVKAAGGLFIAHEAFGFAKNALAEARESNRVNAQTEQAIKSTGGAAKVTTKEISALATAISRKTGIDDEAIQSASNMLLTFTNVRNEAGKGNDIFNQSTSILADMSKVFGTDVSGAAVQLGKALNDPVKGITALTRVGVTFSDQQKEQIKNFVDQGKVASAQQIILKELTKEFGGQAEAQATAGDRLKVTIGNIKEQIGGVLVPIVDRVAGFLADRLPGAIDKLAETFGTIKTAVAPFVADLKAFFKTLSTGFTEDEGTPIERFALLLRDKVLPVVKQFIDFIRANWKPVFVAVAAALLLAVSPIALVVAAFVALYLKFQVVRDFIASAVAFIGAQFAAFRTFVEQVFPQVQEAIGHFVAVVQAAWRLFGDDILQVVGAVWSQVQVVIQTAVGIIENVIKVVLAVINGDWGKAWDALKAIVSVAWEGVKATIGNALTAITGVLGGAGALIGRAASGMWDGIKSAFTSAVNFIIRGWNRIEFKIPGFKVGPIGYDGFTLGVPDIPLLAAGGIVTSPTLAVIGEAGPEAVIPLSHRSSKLGVGGMGGVMLNVSVAPGTDPQAVGRSIVNELERYFRNGGAKPRWAA
jgi:phage-related protein